MANRETVESLSKKIEMMQAQFDVCDKHRRLAEDVVAEQRQLIKKNWSRKMRLCAPM